MALILPFIDRIRMLSRDLISGKNAALNRPPSHEITIMPSSIRGSQRSLSSSMNAMKPRAMVAAPATSAGIDRRWLSSHGRSGRDGEHTRSNLG